MAQEMSNVFLQLDDEIQVSLRAAMEVADDASKLEECLCRLQSHLETYEQLLDSGSDISKYETDYQWKRALIDSLPIGVSSEQLRVAFILVKSRPFLE